MWPEVGDVAWPEARALLWDELGRKQIDVPVPISQMEGLWVWDTLRPHAVDS